MTVSQNAVPEPSQIELLKDLYAAFNERDIEQVLSRLDENVDWPNGWEGGRINGRAAVKQYWQRQFEVLDPKVDPQDFADESDRRIAVKVHQVVHDKGGILLGDQIIYHVYEFRDGLIASMEIRS